MKVIFLGPSTKASGMSVVFELADRLSERNNDVRIVTFDEVIPVDFHPLKTSCYSLNSVLEPVRDADVIIGFYPVSAFFLSEFETKAKKFQLVTDDQRIFYDRELFKFQKELDEDRIEIEYQRQQNYITASYQLPLTYLATNKLLDSQLKQYTKKVKIIPIGVNHELYFPEATFPKSRIRILVEGNMMPWKGVSNINTMLSDLVGYELWTVSDTSFTIKSDKHWKGLTAWQTRQVLSSCDILIRAYKEDGTAELQAQAMACGCVVLTTDTSGAHMFCKDQVNCLILGNNYPSKKLEKLINDKKLREKLIRGGLETAKELDWNKSIDILVKVIGGKNG